jgi:multimeric flavodoxin WrbA
VNGMKVVIINGSYHRNGVISFSVDKFISGLKSSNKQIEFREYNLSNIPIEFCRGCGCCIKNNGKKLGECPQDDSTTIRKILYDMCECDILVYASPIYEKTISALMKRFIERTMPIFYLENHSFVSRNGSDNNNKMGIILVSCATPFPINVILGIAKYSKNILSMFCKAFGCKKIMKIQIAGAYSKDQLKDKYAQQVYNLAAKLGNNSNF